MDAGRYYDLQHLQAVIDDKKSPKTAKEKAEHSKQRILEQARNDQLADLRQQLVHAYKTNNAGRIELLENAINKITNYHGL